MPNLKPSEICKSAGFTLAEVSKTTSVSIQTLNNWHKNKPALFKTIVAGVAALKENEDYKTWHGYKDKSVKEGTAEQAAYERGRLAGIEQAMNP